MGNYWRRSAGVPRWRVTIPPAIEPIPLDDLKSHMHVVGSTDDGYIASTLANARSYLERLQGRAYLTQTRTLTLDWFPSCRHVTLQGAPLQSVTSVVYTPEGGSPTTLDAATYVVDTASEPGRIVLTSSASWPSEQLISTGGVVITYVAGEVVTSGVATITNATPAVVTMTGHGLSNGAGVSFSTTGALPGGLTAERTYRVVQATTNTFQLATAPGGSSIATTSAGSGTHTATSLWRVSESIIQAIKFLAAYWYEQRESVADQSVGNLQEAPLALQTLITVDRIWGVA